MSLSAHQIDQAVDALRVVLPLREPADGMLSRYFREHPKLGMDERAFIAETVFAILRRKRFLEHVAGQATPRKLVLAFLIKIQGLNQRELLPLLTKGETEWLPQAKAVSLESLPLAVQADLPDWLVEKLQGFMTDSEILTLARGMQHPAPLDLRVNTFLATRDEVLQALPQEGIEAIPTQFSPLGLRVNGKPALNRGKLFLDGKIEVQDESSQLLGFLVAPKRGEMIVDFCAGAGGKTLLLGAFMQSQGRIYAFDVSEKRLNNLKPRLKRSGLSNLQPQLINNENDIKIKRLQGKIDRVLVDAPCSGLGTLRRNPDLKWRQTPEAIGELTAKQGAILAAAAKLLKPGGRLVYATCSILPEENEQIVAAFLAAHPGFKLLDCAALLAQQHIPLDTGEYLRLYPHVHATDGFFAAALERIAPSDA
jgi:16S rRNA (cytosine967-C5)-methyltransferase